MLIILYVLGAIVGIIALLMLIALFTKKAYSLQREIVIHKPVGEVFNYIKHIKNQDLFSKWVMTDPNMNRILLEMTVKLVSFTLGTVSIKRQGKVNKKSKILLKTNY